MRKSMMVGLGLWVLAVASVAAIAWIAITTAARPVTALSVSPAATPLSSDPPYTSVPVVPVLPSATGPSSAVTGPPPSTSARPGATTAAGSAGALFGTYTTEGGRVRAQCSAGRASLLGGYARPEPGWLVRVRSDDARLLVVFATQARAIEVMAQCMAGRPAFQERSEPLPFAGTVPPSSPPPSPAPAPPSPTGTASPLARPTGSHPPTPPRSYPPRS